MFVCMLLFLLFLYIESTFSYWLKGGNDDDIFLYETTQFFFLSYVMDIKAVAAMVVVVVE